MSFDPLANMTESPETNEVFKRLGRRLSRFAEDHRIAVDVVHHTRKLNGQKVSIDDVRGGSALIGSARAARVLSPMSRDVGKRMVLHKFTDKEHFDMFCVVGDGKNNLSRSGTRDQWFEREGVQIGNGDTVVAIRSIDLPNIGDLSGDVGLGDAASAFAKFAVHIWVRMSELPQGVQVSTNARSGSHPKSWLRDEFKLSLSRASSVIDDLFRDDVLRVEKRKPVPKNKLKKRRKGAPKPVFELGKNDPRKWPAT